MDPKVLIFIAVIFAAVVIVVLAIIHVAERLKNSDSRSFKRASFKCASFKCVHCKGKYPAADRDSHFGSDMCNTCGEYLIPKASREAKVGEERDINGDKESRTN